MSDIAKLSSMMAYRRPAWSQTEKEFIAKFLSPLGVKEDKFGNHFLIVGANPTVLWSSHTDTVHRVEGFQNTAFDGKFMSLPKRSKSNCLGADCTAGIWIMIEMIMAGIPGLYVFHAAEEIGCVGSRRIATELPSFLDGIKAAVAFDRRGTEEVITHQGSRTASDAFALSFAKQLPARFKPSDKGFLTDTKTYKTLVPECSNISVGYHNEHHPDEILNVQHLFELRDHMIKFDVTQLAIERDPKVVEPKKKFKKAAFSRLQPTSVEDLVWTYPEKTALLLEEMGITFDDLRYFIHGEQQLRLTA